MIETARLKFFALGILAAAMLTGVRAQQAGTADRLSTNRSPVAPSNEQIQAAVNEAYTKFSGDASGKNADYIPYLAHVDSNLFGIAGATTDGRIFLAGDVAYAFSIQSISKVFTLALAMEELGPDKVFQQIGSEPTGRPFNSVQAVEDLRGHTGNPLVNAGAIATTSLISGDAATKWNKILAFYSKAAGEQLKIIDEVYKSEAATNMHNKAIAMLLASYDRMYSDPLDATDVYTKQCSIGVTAKQLAVMGATLSNFGVNPRTGEQVIKRENIPHILAVMSMAGLYDDSGEWAWHVGLPAKSGVGGGILAVVPGKGAVVGFSPRLDAQGNSVRAQESIAYVADKLNLNLYSPGSVGLK